MSNPQEQLKLRQERVAKTFKREIPDKVPIFLAAEAYSPFYLGLKPTDVTDYDKAMDISKKVAADLNYDCTYYPYTPQNLVLSPCIEALGGSVHVVNEEFIKQINPENVTIMEPEDYPGFIKDPFNYLLEEIYPRRYKTLAGNDDEEKYQKIVGMMKSNMTYGAYCAKFEEEAGIVVLQDAQLYFNPVDIIFDLLRDFRGIVRDIKKRPEEVRDAGLAMVDGILKYAATKKVLPHKAFFCPMHLPTFLTPKDFEKVYWPSFKKLTEGIVAMGHNILFEFEVDYGHLFEFLQELPKTNIAGIFEMKDLKLVKEKLGNTMSIVGGLDTNTLYHGTEQDCIDMVKKLIDDLAPGGGYMLGPSTPLTFPIDAKKENLKAALDFANEYGIYK
ncbi:uroporphyrinogen decarboxylase family protein [Eubacterium sp. 1001713B170207_170306_E7]|uniref:uroporphyrinogen decarboxylase family protein n=1 Tax=Eubacterium sp. 1001713B170207_170306_E7 TaxID=2787097 RepID=UPI00189B743B|nr:uroporphyrinogen decarboxylase family protein [Eubacterium sp. 1001713B170207_170306_E7]